MTQTISRMPTKPEIILFLSITKDTLDTGYFPNIYDDWKEYVQGFELPVPSVFGVACPELWIQIEKKVKPLHDENMKRQVLHDIIKKYVTGVFDEIINK